MKKFLVLRGEGPMPIHHQLWNIFQKYLIQKKRVEFSKTGKITTVDPLRSENSDFLMKFKIVGEVELGPYTESETLHPVHALPNITYFNDPL